MKMHNEKNLDEFYQCIKNKDVYLWGAGAILDKCNSFIDSIGPQVKGIFDKNSAALPLQINGVSVLSLDKLSLLNPANTVFLITCIYVGEIEDFLRDKGYIHIYSIFPLASNLGGSFHPPLSSADDEFVNKVKNLLADEKSKHILEKICFFRNKKICDYRDIYQENQYFCDDVWTLTDHEVFVDAGAFVGDTIQDFRQKTGNSYKRIYAFEPDKKNFSQLKEVVQGDARIETFPYAVWNKAEMLNFSEGDKSSSAIDNKGDLLVEAKAIDSIITEEITLLKMDVEGAELAALNGAKELIKKWKPKLAICVYHKFDDLWEIPFYIKSLVPEYKFYLRHHHKTWLETVLYAKIE